MTKRKLEPAEQSLIANDLATGLLNHHCNCRRRYCRRARWCSFTGMSTNPLYGDTPPLCITELRTSAAETFAKHINMIVRICNGQVPPYPHWLPDVRAIEEAALAYLPRVAALLPDFADHINDWIKTYTQPPAPEIDSGALLAELRGEMKRMGLKW